MRRSSGAARGRRPSLIHRLHRFQPQRDPGARFHDLAVILVARHCIHTPLSEGLVMLLRAAARILVLAVIMGIVARIVPGFHVYGHFGTYVWLAFLFSVVNLIVGPILRLLSLPLIILTLGLFLLVINAALLAITAGLSSKLDIDSFGSAVFGGFLIALFSWFAEMIFPLRRQPD